MKSLRFASTKRIWKAIFIEETRRNVLWLCENFGFLRWNHIFKFHLTSQSYFWISFGPKNDLKIIFLNFIWKTKIHKVIGNSQWNKAFLQNKIIIYIIQILNIIKDSFKKLQMKSLRFASTRRIWKAIFIQETRRNVLTRCKIFWFFQSKSM